MKAADRQLSERPAWASRERHTSEVADSVVALPSAAGAEWPLAETSLSFAVRLRHGLLGAALGLLALATAVALGVWIVSAVFHTAPGALA